MTLLIGTRLSHTTGQSLFFVKHPVRRTNKNYSDKTLRAVNVSDIILLKTHNAVIIDFLYYYQILFVNQRLCLFLEQTQLLKPYMLNCHLLHAWAVLVQHYLGFKQYNGK